MAISACPQLTPKYFSLALWLSVIPLPHRNTAEHLAQSSLKGDQTSPIACRPLGYPKCFKAIRAMASTMFIVQYFGERELDLPGGGTQPHLGVSFLLNTGKKEKQ